MKKTLLFLFGLFFVINITAAPKFKGVNMIAPLKATLLMATTTSTDNTGLLNYLAPKFQHDTGIELKWVAVGTGQALEIGKNCDADVLLVHAPKAEKKYVAKGYGVKRKQVMYNQFVLIGPKDDPAHIKNFSIIKAFKVLAQKHAVFISRGDNSGTNKRELQIWQQANIIPPQKSTWYLEAGQGMLATIRMAEQKHGYTLTDSGTYIKYAANHNDKPALVILVKGDKLLRNQYSVILVNPKRCPKVKTKLAWAFSKWIRSKSIQKDIADYRLLGKEMFTPNA